MILVFFMEWLEGFGIYHFGIIVAVVGGDFFFWNNNNLTYPGLSHLYGGGIEILTIGNGEALNKTLNYHYQ